MDWSQVLSKPEVIWFLIGLILIILEFSLPGLIIIFFGAGAWVTSICCILFDIDFNVQIIIFLLTSIISLVVLRRHIKERFFDKDSNLADTLEEEFVGREAVAITEIKKNQTGRIEFKGTEWKATSDVTIKKGQNVRITSKDSIVLKVQPLK